MSSKRSLPSGAAQWVDAPVMGSFEFVDGKISHWRDDFEMKPFTGQLPSG